MENKSIKELEEELLKDFTSREKKVLRETEDKGAKAISPTMASQLFELFLESYSCAEIAKSNKDKGLSEGDILVCRKKYKWDEQKEEYAIELNRQVKDKLIKAKLESVEFLTNTLAITHRINNEKIKKFLQSGGEEIPEGVDWAKNPGAYKAIWETINKITGEERVQKQEIKSEQKVVFENTNSGMTQEDQSALLKRLVEKKIE